MYPFPSPGDLPNPRIEPRSPALQADSLPAEPQGQKKHRRFRMVYCLRKVFSSVQSLSHVRLFVTPWITAHQASLSIINSQSSLRFMSIESVMPSSHVILCCPLLLLPPIPPSIWVFSNIRGFSIESGLRIRWPKYWSFRFNISPSNEHSGTDFL